MRVTYTNSIEDWAAAQAHYLETWPGFGQSILFWRWTIAVGLGIVAFLVASDWPGWAKGLLGALVTLALYLWYPRYVRTGYVRRALAQLNMKEARPFLTCQRVVELSDEGLRIESLVGYQLVKWGFIKGVDDSAGRVFIMFRYGLGLPIPSSCMSAPEKESLVCGIRAKIATG
jgi:hypothetical protein